MLFIGLLGLTPKNTFAQAGEMQGTGTGTVTLAGETYDATFELWGEDGQTTLIKGHADGDDFEVAISSGEETEAQGTFSPCEGGTCPCTLSANEEETEVRGSCDVSGYGKLQISFTIDD